MLLQASIKVETRTNERQQNANKFPCMPEREGGIQWKNHCCWLTENHTNAQKSKGGQARTKGLRKINRSLMTMMFGWIGSTQKDDDDPFEAEKTNDVHASTEVFYHMTLKPQ